MSYSVTQRPDWIDAVRKTHRFFKGNEYANEKLEERIVFYCQMMEDHALLQAGKKIVDLGAGIYWFDPLIQLLGAEVHLVDDFGGHVREPILEDLKIICERNTLEVIAQYGRNFIGRDSQVLAWIPQLLPHKIAAITQNLMQLTPTLCSDIHVVGPPAR